MERLNLNKPIRIKLERKKKKNQSTNDAMFEKMYEKTKEELKKLKPAKLNEWMEVSERFPDDSTEKILFYSPESKITELLPSSLALQHVIYNLFIRKIKMSGFKFMRFKNI